MFENSRFQSKLTENLEKNLDYGQHYWKIRILVNFLKYIDFSQKSLQNLEFIRNLWKISISVIILISL